MRKCQPYFGRREEQREYRDLTVREITLRADSINEATRSVEAVIATENRVTVFDLRSYEPIDEVLLMSGMESPDQVPLLASHNRGCTSPRMTKKSSDRGRRSSKSTFATCRPATASWITPTLSRGRRPW
jgi:hypothetical protein